jgi:hypothetical protein
MQPRRADATGMSLRGQIRLALCVLLLAFGGCLMPAQGTPVFVDHRAGSFWSGKGMLLDTKDENTRCMVAVRDRALIVHQRWVECRWVHERTSP